jgi:hypothetical protein
MNGTVQGKNRPINKIPKELRTRDYIISDKIKNVMIVPYPTKRNENEKILGIVKNYEKYYDLTFLQAIVYAKSISK